MASGLVKLGMLILAASLVALLLSSGGFHGVEPLEPWIDPGLIIGGLLVIGGLAAGLAGRVGRAALSSRCRRCGAPVARGQVFCADHLKATVDEARDQLHTRGLDRGAQG